MDFPKTMIKAGMILTVNNQKWYEAALNSWFKEKVDDEQKEDSWHRNLIYDIKAILERAEEWRFHDFRTKSATPKWDLIEIFHIMIQNVTEWKYDN